MSATCVNLPQVNLNMRVTFQSSLVLSMYGRRQLLSLRKYTALQTFIVYLFIADAKLLPMLYPYHFWQFVHLAQCLNDCSIC